MKRRKCVFTREELKEIALAAKIAEMVEKKSRESEKFMIIISRAKRRYFEQHIELQESKKFVLPFLDLVYTDRKKIINNGYRLINLKYRPKIIDCPHCRTSHEVRHLKVHSSRIIKIADLPYAGYPVILNILYYRYFCPANKTKVIHSELPLRWRKTQRLCDFYSHLYWVFDKSYHATEAFIKTFAPASDTTLKKIVKGHYANPPKVTIYNYPFEMIIKRE